MRKFFWLLFVSITIALIFVSCKDDFDRISSSAADQPSFSQDTVRVDTLFSDVTSSTRQLMVYNRNKKSIRLDRVYLSDPKLGFRVNVDGHAGREFENLTILPGDSMYIFVEANFKRDDAADPIAEVKDKLFFETKGVRKSVLLQGYRCNADVVNSIHVRKDTTISSKIPLLVRDSIVVDKGVRLNIEAGARVCFFAGSYMKVYGTLIAEGTVHKPIVFEGERQDMMLSDLPYPLVSGQWGGIRFGKQSHGNRMTSCTVRNAMVGLMFMEERQTSEDLIYMKDSKVTNMKGYGIYACGGKIRLDNTEVSNTLDATLQLQGCDFEARACTFANFYLFDSKFFPTVNYYDSYKTGSGEVKHVDGSRFSLNSCVVDGTRNMSGDENSKDGRSGELSITLSDSSRFDQIVSIRHSYLRMPKKNLVASAMKDCLLAKKMDLKKDRYYVYLGYDTSRQKDRVTFVFDLRPIEGKAPFEHIGVLFPDLATDRLGLPRKDSPAAGCYNPVPFSL